MDGRSMSSQLNPLRWAKSIGSFVLAFADDLTNEAVASKGTPDGDKEGEYLVPGCCYLALPNTECAYTGSKSNYTCPSGYYRQWWYCTEGSRRRACAECTTSRDNCWTGDFNCSIWWWA